VFVGHYAVSFAAKRLRPEVPIWVLFVAVQLLDVLWAPLVLLGVERVRIVPGVTASNPLDLYYMPYTHSLVAAALWALVALFIWRMLPVGAARTAGKRRGGAIVLAAAVFSHWMLDLVVHRPDLPLVDNTMKVGLGLWDRPALAFGLEAGLLLGGMVLHLRGSGGRAAPWLIFGVVMLAVHAVAFFGAPPRSASAAAIMALAAYAAFAGAAAWLERRAARSRNA
jgi:hypothetical protein